MSECHFFAKRGKEMAKHFDYAQGRESAAPMTPSRLSRHIGAFPIFCMCCSVSAPSPCRSRGRGGEGDRG